MSGRNIMTEDQPPPYVVQASDTVASPMEMAASANITERPGLLRIKSKRLWKQFAGDTLTSARMHTVGSTSERTLMHASDRTLEVLEAQKATTATSCAPMEDSPMVAAPLKQLDTWTSFSSDYLLQVPEGGSLGAAVFGIIKGTVGPAILYLPRGFQISGYAVAIPSMLFATIMYIYNSHRLLACWKVEHDKDVLKFGEHSRSLLTYPELARRALGNFSVLVDIGIASMQFGVCLTYLIFVPHNLFECTQALLGIEVDRAYFLVAMLVLEIPLSWIRDITKLTPTNVVATGLIAYGLFFVLVLAFIHGMAMTGEGGTRIFIDNLQNLPAITDSWFLFVGTSFFMMEGSITLIMPLQESLVRSEDRARFPITNQNVTAGIVIFYVLFSIICCGAFGDDIHTALTASLDGTIAMTIQLAYSAAVILTFPLQAFPAMEVLKNNLLGPENDDHVQRSVLSTLVICLLGVVAICAIDYLGNVVSILGALFGIPLALVVPPLMHNKLVTDSSKATKWLNYVVVAIGFMAMGAASFGTIASWDKGADVET